MLIAADSCQIDVIGTEHRFLQFSERFLDREMIFDNVFFLQDNYRIKIVSVSKVRDPIKDITIYSHIKTQTNRKEFFFAKMLFLFFTR